MGNSLNGPNKIHLVPGTMAQQREGNLWSFILVTLNPGNEVGKPGELSKTEMPGSPYTWTEWIALGKVSGLPRFKGFSTF